MTVRETRVGPARSPVTTSTIVQSILLGVACVFRVHAHHSLFLVFSFSSPSSSLLPTPFRIAHLRRPTPQERAASSCQANVTHIVHLASPDPYSDPRISSDIPAVIRIIQLVFVCSLIFPFVLDLPLAFEPFLFLLSQRTSSVAGRPYTHTHTHTHTHPTRPCHSAYSVRVDSPLAWLRPWTWNYSPLFPRFARVPTASLLTLVTTPSSSLHRTFSDDSDPWNAALVLFNYIHPSTFLVTKLKSSNPQ